MMYQQVYFYIDSGYCTERWTQETAERFHEESDRIFEDAGWTILTRAYNGRCTTVVKGKLELYLHPTSFSGVILPEEIPGIEMLNGNIWTCTKCGAEAVVLEEHETL